MDIKIVVKLSTKDKSWLCFNHAVQLSLNAEKAEKVLMEVSEADGEYYNMRDGHCVVCLDEESEREARGYRY